MIPDELKALPQWVAADADKIPLDPRTGRRADVTDPSTWATYEQALSTKRQHVGFVLTPDDPYTIIDLDAPDSAEQQRRGEAIIAAFPTYIEWSQSGRGLHIICRGHVPRGARRDRVEVYSEARYIICTGNVYKAEPIRPCQEMLDILFAEMNPVADYEELDSTPGNLSDQEVFETAANAVNSDKFLRLCRGEWQDEYPSQSEADFALLSMFCFYTRDNEQVRRLFRMSGLGQRDKAKRHDYLNRAVGKIRATQPLPVDLSAFALAPSRMPDDAVETRVVETHPVAPSRGIKAPPGLIGDIAHYIYSTSSRPVPEVSICAAVALIAGIVGRQYNISGTGLNQYIIMLARTGVGKEEAASGIDRIVSAVRPTVPMIDQFVGPGVYASGQAIIRTLDQQPSVVSVLGEFGLTLQAISDAKADSNSIILRRVLLDLYVKSGWGKVLRPSAYSDATKNTKAVASPALTLLGESTPETFYAGLSHAHIADGLVPRFLVVEYSGDRPDRNRSNAFTPPPAELVQRVATLVTTVLMMMQNNACAVVGIEPTAEAALNDFDAYCDTQIRIGGNEVVRQLWNRAHLKALRLAALLAVAGNPTAPQITRADTDWALALVQGDVERMVDRFDQGDIGEGDSKQLVDLLRIVREYTEQPYEVNARYGGTLEMYEKGVIPYIYLLRRTANLQAFKTDRKGATAALKGALDALINAGRLLEVTKQQMHQYFGTSSLGYVARTLAKR